MTENARERLEEVHAQLNEAASAGDADAGELAGTIGAYLGKEARSTEDDEDILDRLRLGVRRWEANHPTLSEAVQRVIDSLTAAGI